MSLKTTVKVGSITNLSDARYCAGMGVDILGFNPIEGKPDYINPIQFEELRGWFVGPKVVIELYGIDHHDTFEKLLHDYQPDMVELSCRELLKLRPKEFPLILALTEEEYRERTAVLRDFKSSIKYLQLPATTDNELLSEIIKEFPVLLEFTDAVDMDFIKQNPRLGLSLKGSAEEKAGYKSYDQLSGVLELLEHD